MPAGQGCGPAASRVPRRVARSVIVPHAAASKRSYAPAYRRTDFATRHADAARRAFAAELAKGPARLDAAAAWLAAGAEDDALATNSPVALPVTAFAARLDALADAAAAALPDFYDPTSATDPGPHQAALDCVTAAVFGPPPGGGRPFVIVPATSLPPGVLLDAPGTVEAADPAYLHTALTARKIAPATAAVLLAAVHARLISRGALGCAARVSWAGERGGDGSGGVRATVAVVGARAIRRPDGTPLTTLPLSALEEANALLLRAFWAGPWQTHPLSPDPADARGGFGGLAAAMLGEPGRATSADVAAINRTAAHRLERGIFTSPGAGDARRALAAARRRVLLAEAAGGESGGCASSADVARREYGALLAAAGRHAEAAAELGAYVRAAEAGGDEGAPPGEVEAAVRLLAASVAATAPDPPPPPLSIAAVLAAPPPEEVVDDSKQIAW
jgi:hypothetical protein